MVMIWLEPNESILIGENCLLSVLNISADEVRLCVTVRGNSCACLPEFDGRTLMAVHVPPAAVIAVASVESGRVCLDIEVLPDITFQRLQAYVADHRDQVADFSQGKNVFIDRRKDEYVFVEAK